MTAQGWLVGGLVALATWHMVRSGLRWLRRVRAGGSGCGGCSGEGCASACGTAGRGDGVGAPVPLGQPAPVHWHLVPLRARQQAQQAQQAP